MCVCVWFNIHYDLNVPYIQLESVPLCLAVPLYSLCSPCSKRCESVCVCVCMYVCMYPRVCVCVCVLADYYKQPAGDCTIYITTDEILLIAKYWLVNKSGENTEPLSSSTAIQSTNK